MWIRLSMIGLSFCIVAMMLNGCAKKQVERVVETRPPLEHHDLIAPKPIVTPSAFDITNFHDGAFLIWAEPKRSGGGIKGVRLSAYGTALQEEIRIYETPHTEQVVVTSERVVDDALEIAASSYESKLAVAWVNRHQTQLSVMSAMGSIAETGANHFESFSLGSTVRRQANERGNISVSVASNLQAAFVLMKGAAAECDPSRNQCIVYALHGIYSSQEDSNHYTVQSIREPFAMGEQCARSIAGSTFAQRQLYYAICAINQAKQSVSIFYTANNQSASFLERCDPAGLFSIGQDIYLVGSCTQGRTVMLFSNETKAWVSNLFSDTTIQCESNIPIIHTISKPRQTIRMTQPASHIESIFPPTIAPEGSRAVWTGNALLVAIPIGSEVSIHRFQCDGAQFVRTDLL